MKIKTVTILALLFNIIYLHETYAQANPNVNVNSGSFSVGGSNNSSSTTTADFYYPVFISDPGWGQKVATEIEIGRSEIHTNSINRGSMIAKFRFHTDTWGHGSNFIDADVKNFDNITTNNEKFIAGWEDVSIESIERGIIIWLKGKVNNTPTSYFFKSNLPITIEVYDGEYKNALGVAFPEYFTVRNGLNSTKKVLYKINTINDYANANGLSQSGSIYVNGNAPSYVVGNLTVGSKSLTSDKLHVSNGILGVDNGANNFIKAGDYLSIGNTNVDNFPYIGFNAQLTKSTGSVNEFSPYSAATANAAGLIIKGDKEQAGLHFLQKKYGTATTPNNLNTFAEVLTLTNDGKVGIGTTNPQTSLAVKGTIQAQKVKVTVAAADWPDYVFAPHYKLLPLTEVAKYIQHNKHLPGVPSAENMAKTNLDVAEGQAMLLKKIEELTLYVIELEKKVEKLKQEKAKKDTITKK